MMHVAERFGHRPLALLPAFARMPYVNNQPNAPDRNNGVAVIPVVGVLTSDRPYSGETAYADISRAFLAAMNDDAARSVVLLINSPGGHVAGMMDLADTIYRSRKIKPIRAILAEGAFSAAYLLASACDRVTVPRTGGTGSVGVISFYLDGSGALRQAGITPTVFRSAPNKNEATGLEPLSSAAAARAQAEVDELGGIFAEAVARNRKMTTAAVKATRGQTYTGAAGVSVGFADAVASPDAEFQAVQGLASSAVPGKFASADETARFILNAGAKIRGTQAARTVAPGRPLPRGASSDSASPDMDTAEGVAAFVLNAGRRARGQR